MISLKWLKWSLFNLWCRMDFDSSLDSSDFFRPFECLTWYPKFGSRSSLYKIAMWLVTIEVNFFMITFVGSLKWRTKVIEQQSLGLRDSESSGKRGNSVRYSLLSSDYWWVNSGEWPHRTARASMFSSVKNLLPGLICINWVVSDVQMFRCSCRCTPCCLPLCSGHALVIVYSELWSVYGSHWLLVSLY